MAIQCNPSDIHLQCTSLNFTSSNEPFSVTCWMNAVWNPGTRRSFVGLYGTNVEPFVPGLNPTVALQVGTSAGNGDLTCWTWGGGTQVTTATGVMTPFNNQWVLITYTYDGTTHRLYRNDQQLATSTTVPPVGKFYWIYINGYPTSPTGEVSNHLVDSYTYYNRTLSLGEIQTIFTARGTRNGVIQGTLAKYDFDERAEGQSILEVVDISGNDNSLTLTGAGTPVTYAYVNTTANANLRPVQ